MNINPAILSLLLTTSVTALAQRQSYEHVTEIVQCSSPNYSEQDIDRVTEDFIEKKFNISLNDAKVDMIEQDEFVPLKHIPLFLISIFIDSPGCVRQRHLKRSISVKIDTGDNSSECRLKEAKLEITMTDGSSGSGDYSSDIEVIQSPKCI